MPWRVRKFEGSRDGEDGVVKRKGGINGGRWGVLDIGEVIIYYINSIGIGVRFRLMGSREVVSGRGRENQWKILVCTGTAFCIEFLIAIGYRLGARPPADP